MPSQGWLSLLPCLRRNEKEKFFLDNGSILLEDLIASCDGKSNPVRCYSADELIKATNNFHPSCIIQRCFDYKMFKGFLDDRSIIIKKFVGSRDDARSLAIRDIVISIQMSSHKNVLKLLGCCLELPIPALVLEYATKGVLNYKGGFGANESPPWKTRLCVAKQLANALTYLHAAFPRPIIHCDLTPGCIFLDNDSVPKLCNFSLSVTIPPKQSHAEVKQLIFWNSTCERSGYVSEKTDVFYFGFLLLIFLMGQEALAEITDQAGEYEYLYEHIPKVCASGGQIETFVDPKIVEEVGGDEQAQQQLHDFLALALLCTQDKDEAKPYMIDVAKELVRIEKSILPC